MGKYGGGCRHKDSYFRRTNMDCRTWLQTENSIVSAVSGPADLVLSSQSRVESCVLQNLILCQVHTNTNNRSQDHVLLLGLPMSHRALDPGLLDTERLNDHSSLWCVKSNKPWCTRIGAGSLMVLRTLRINNVEWPIPLSEGLLPVPPWSGLC